MHTRRRDGDNSEKGQREPLIGEQQRGFQRSEKKELVGEAMTELQGFGGVPLDGNVFEVHNLFWVIGRGVGGEVWILARSE
jgi:hypothetical protein